jgi:hypothetical protein
MNYSNKSPQDRYTLTYTTTAAIGDRSCIVLFNLYKSAALSIQATQTLLGSTGFRLLRQRYGYHQSVTDSITAQPVLGLIAPEDIAKVHAYVEAH